jgi:hypothetical protein
MLLLNFGGHTRSFPSVSISDIGNVNKQVNIAVNVATSYT